MKEHLDIGDIVKDSPVGAGKITNFTQRGYPQVNEVAVAWLELEDGTLFDPHNNKLPAAIPSTAERKTTPSRFSQEGVEVTDAMVEAACAAGCKVDDPSFEWPGDYSPTEQATGRKCVRAALEAALSVLPTPPIMEGETHD